MVIDWRFDESWKFKGEFEKRENNMQLWLWLWVELGLGLGGTINGVLQQKKKGKMWKLKMNSWRLSVDNVDDDMGVWV